VLEEAFRDERCRPRKTQGSLDYKRGMTLEPRQGREGHRAAHHAAREHDQSFDDGGDHQDHGQEDDGRKHRVSQADRGRILMQVSPEDDHAAADCGAAGECNVASEDENVAGDRPVEKNISREDAHAAGGASLNVGRAEKAAGVMESLLSWENNIPANVEYVR
jgi:hypothetical protein